MATCIECEDVTTKKNGRADTYAPNDYNHDPCKYPPKVTVATSLASVERQMTAACSVHTRCQSKKQLL